MADILGGLAQPINHVAQAYDRRTGQLENQRRTEMAEQSAARAEQRAVRGEERALRSEERDIQRQRDNDMLKVFEFAGDGRTDEARYYAKAKGLDVPQEIYTNADFAKGLTLAGKLYGDDQAAAQKFVTAWASSNGMDFDSRLASAQQAAGVPVSKDDRDYQQKIRFEKWKIDNIPQKKDISRFKAGQDSYNSVIQAMGTPEQAEQSRQASMKAWDAEYGTQAAAGARPGVSGGLMGGGAQAPLNVRNNNALNLRDPATSQYRQFATPQEGLQAGVDDLMAKVSGRSPIMQERYGAGYTPTLTNVISTWAPPTENDTQAYINFISQNTGIDPNQPLTPADVNRIAPFMIQMEGGGQAVDYYSQHLNGNAPAAAPDAEATYADALTAIQRGANQEMVFNRLRENGLDPAVIANRLAPAAGGAQPAAPAAPAAPQIQFTPDGGNGYNQQTGYYSTTPMDSHLSSISKGLTNLTNVPAHLRNLLSAGGSAVQAGANAAQRGVAGVQQAAGAVGDYLTESRYIRVTAPDGNAGYIPREQLQLALQQGYTVGNAGYDVPLAD